MVKHMMKEKEMGKKMSLEAAFKEVHNKKPHTTKGNKGAALRKQLVAIALSKAGKKRG